MRKNNLFPAICAFLAVILFACRSCDTTPDIVKHNWELVWQDEFDIIPADSLPDAAKWTYDVGRGPNGDGWGNGEWQIYTEKRTDNVSVDSVDGTGCLMITARKEGTSYTSARIKTLGLFEQGYGRFEARIKMPWGPGIWPAFWLLGADIGTVGWPMCGEIDIMENKGYQPSIVHGTVHGPGYSGGNAITRSFGLEYARFDTDYHVYAVEWTESYIDFYVDETLYQRITASDVAKKGNWVFNHPFFIILNVAVGGNFVGYTTEDTKFPQTMYVDYVRVYRAE